MMKIRFAIAILLGFALMVTMISCSSEEIDKEEIEIVPPTPVEKAEVLEPEPEREFIESFSKTMGELPNDYTLVVKEYFQHYYDTQINLEISDPAELFEFSKELDYKAHMALWEILVAQRSSQLLPANLQEYFTALHYIKLEKQQNGEVDVYVKEYAQLEFAEYDDIYSFENNILHFFRLKKVDDQYKIVKHMQSNGIFTLLFYGMEIADLNPSEVDNTNSLEYILANKDNILKAINNNAKERKKAFTDQKNYVSLPKWSNEYNRIDAYQYAMQWVDDRNPDWEMYDYLGGNCANYTSQAMYSGGIPMDYSGEHQWKWYDDYSNSTQMETGRSASWSGVEAFYEYAKSNVDSGLVAGVDANLYKGDVGDIIQLGVGDHWKHQVIIVGVREDENGNVVDYLVNSNTADQTNYPLSSYSYPNSRLIKIYGWNLSITDTE